MIDRLRFARLAASLAAVATILLPAAARADWFEASSPHFVIYGDVPNGKVLERFVTNLERFHGAMAMVTGVTPEPVSRSNRVTIYGVGSQQAVRKLYGERAMTKYVLGFYLPRAGRTVAFVPDITGDNDGMVSLPFKTLLHEYAHHFLISNSARLAPRWMDEGAAEFFSTANFSAAGQVGVGRPNPKRLREIVDARDVTVTDLLDPESYEKRRGKATGYDAFYGKSWLLYHYLNIDSARRGQLHAYLQGLAAGKASRVAADAAFGNLDTLEREIDAYGRRPKLTGITIRAGVLPVGAVTIRSLRDSEVAVLPIMAQVDRRAEGRTNPADAVATAEQARAVAARFAQDTTVQAVLAEAEFQAGNDAAALAASDRAIAADPQSIRAHAVRLQTLYQLAAKSRAEVDLDTFRAAVVALNRLENDHPLPLILYHRSFAIQGKPASAVAVSGLERAVELAPYALGLRMTLAMQHLRDGKMAAARAQLSTVAFSAHQNRVTEAARRLLERLDADPQWKGTPAIED